MTATEPNTTTPKLGRNDLWPLAGFLLVTAAAYYKTLFLGAVYFEGDLAQYNGPHYHYSAQRLRQFQLPLWNPYLYGGTPFLANPETGVFYPPTWIALVLPVEWAVTILGISHQLLGAALTCLFCRLVLRLRPPASFCAGLVFGYSGYLPAHFEQTAHLMAAAWLPGVLMAYFRGRQTGRPTWYAACGLMIAAAILAGGVQNVYMTCLALVLCGLAEAVRALPVDQPRWTLSNSASPLLPVAAAGLIAAGAGAAQLVPTLAFLPESTRSGGLTIRGAASYSVPPAHVPLLLICPHFFGHQGTTYWGVWRQHEMTLYTGILPLVLAVGTAVLHRRARYVRLLTLLAVVALGMALGDSSPLYPFAYRWLPGLAWFRAPARFSLLFGFAVAALAAIGLDRLLVRKPHVSWRRFLTAMALSGGAMVLTAGYLLMRDDMLSLLVRIGMPSADRDPLLIMQQITSLGRSRGAWWNYYLSTFSWTLLMVAAAWGVLLILERSAARSHRQTKWTAAALTLIIVDLLVFNSGLSQIARAGARHETRRRADWIAYLQANLRGNRCELPDDYPPNQSMFHNLPVGDGYGAFLPQRRHQQLQHARDRRDALGRWRELFAVAYRVHAGEVPASPGVVFRSTETDHEILYAATAPRARVVFEARRLPASEALDTVFEPEFDVASIVVLERTAQPVQPPDAPAPPAHPNAAPQVEIFAEEPEHLRFRVSTPKPAYLVLADAFYPGWHASVDAAPVPLLRANVYFRAVAVPAGRSMVEMHYADRSIWWGIGVSAITWLAATGWSVARARTSCHSARGAAARSRSH